MRAPPAPALRDPNGRDAVRLGELLSGHDHEVLRGDPAVDIHGGISYDSRRLDPGSLFIAMRGVHTDGHQFLHQAADRGAAAILLEDRNVGIPPGMCAAWVPDVRVAAPVVASRYHGEPGRQMDMVAVTGTNGKTSVTHMIEYLLRAVAQERVGVIGTVGHRVGDDPVGVATTTPTTPEAVDLQQILSLMRQEAAGTVVLEASSMGLARHRLDRTFIDVGVFTNLTADHLDDHGTMEAYKRAKIMLFEGLAEHAVSNIDDPVGREIAALMPDAVTTFGIAAEEGDFRAEDLAIDALGTKFTLYHEGRARRVRIPIPGRFAVANSLAAVAACFKLGHDLDSLVDAVAELRSPPGRFETVRVSSGATVIVDYAHSPDALDNVLTTIRTFARNRVITVFGCGGDRDPSKRAAMGRIAGLHSDLCIVTSDNPRSEDPESIIDAIVPGVSATRTPVERVTDRRDAIRRALHVASPQDIVLIAGKGSEPYQIFGDRIVPFDDVETVREVDQEPTSP